MFPVYCVSRVRLHGDRAVEAVFYSCLNVCQSVQKRTYSADGCAYIRSGDDILMLFFVQYTQSWRLLSNILILQIFTTESLVVIIVKAAVAPPWRCFHSLPLLSFIPIVLCVHIVPCSPQRETPYKLRFRHCTWHFPPIEVPRELSHPIVRLKSGEMNRVTLKSCGVQQTSVDTRTVLCSRSAPPSARQTCPDITSILIHKPGAWVLQSHVGDDNFPKHYASYIRSTQSHEWSHS